MGRVPSVKQTKPPRSTSGQPEVILFESSGMDGVNAHEALSEGADDPMFLPHCGTKNTYIVEDSAGQWRFTQQKYATYKPRDNPQRLPQPRGKVVRQIAEVVFDAFMKHVGGEVHELMKTVLIKGLRRVKKASYECILEFKPQSAISAPCPDLPPVSSPFSSASAPDTTSYQVSTAPSTFTYLEEYNYDNLASSVHGLPEVEDFGFEAQAPWLQAWAGASAHVCPFHASGLSASDVASTPWTDECRAWESSSPLR